MAMKRSRNLLGGFFDSMPTFAAPKSPTAEARAERVDRPVGEIRNRAFLLEQGFAREVERAAREIMDAAETRELRHAAIRWKLGLLNALALASSSPDPLVSLFDCWVLAGQMEAFFKAGAGKDVFGPHQAIAVGASERVMQQCEECGKALTTDGDISAGREAVDAWVEDHPIQDLSFFRSSTAVLYADTAHRVVHGMGETMVDFVDLAQDLSYRVKALSMRLPSQASGETELLLDGAVRTLDSQGLQASLDGLSASLDRLDGTLRPKLDEALALSEKALATVSAERSAALDQIDRLSKRLLRALILGFGGVATALVVLAWLLWRIL